MKTGTLISRIALAVVTIVGATHSYALGILVPSQPEFSPIRLADATVSVSIKQNIAKTRVVQEFYNPNPRQLEADFYFPIPKGANVTDFVLYMNGKPVKGEVLEKEKAREIYEGIVRRMKDPGLLEWIDYNLFKVRVFPVPPSGIQKIELEFAQPLEADQSQFKYTFPLKTPKVFRDEGPGSAKVEFTVDVESDEPVRNLYSPSHTVDTDLKDPKHARVKLASSSLLGGGDFILFYELSRKDVAVSLLASRMASEDGFFALMLSPQMRYDKSKANPQDVTFVIDTSGSMLDDNKIEQARRALIYCVGQLKEDDRFDVIRFSTEVEKFRDGLQAVSKDNVEAAKNWIGKLEARGGTNISGALQEALSLNHGDKGTSESSTRIYTVVFITDGIPTIGTVNADKIIEEAKTSDAKNVRVFTFGLGNDVNAKLLDKLAESTRAVAEYIRPGQDMEVPIGRFFDKISQPAMTGLKLEMPSADVYDLYPKELPDLFYGTQLTVFGRYKKPGQTAIKLSGNAAGKVAEFVYEKSLPEKEIGNEFVEKLWGTRKIAYLLDEIRGHGESGELKDEVVRLSKKYGVATPYTSFLVADDREMAQVQPPMQSGPVRREHSTVGMFSQGRTVNAPSPKDQLAARGGNGLMAAEAPASNRKSASFVGAEFRQESGSNAIAASKAIREMKDASKTDEIGEDMRTAAGRTFVKTSNVWVDTAIGANEETKLKVKYLSNAYFDLLKANPTLEQVFALGDHVRVKLAAGILEVSEDGTESIESTDLAMWSK